MGITVVKIGAVVMLLTNGRDYNFQWAFGSMIDSINDLLDIVTSYVGWSTSLPCSEAGRASLNADGINGSYAIWARVDCALKGLIGGVFQEGPGLTANISMGVVGFFLACMISGKLGIFIGTLGLMFIMQMIKAVCRAAYIYLTAYFGLCADVHRGAVFSYRLSCSQAPSLISINGCV